MNESRSRRLTLIEPARHGFLSMCRDLTEYRAVLYQLALRDIKIKYKQAYLGIGWAVLQPVITMVIFTIIFGKLAGLQSGDVPYSIFTFAGILPWQLFSVSLSSSSLSLVSSANLLKRVYFPRILIPLAAIIPNIVDYILGFVVLVGMMIWYHSSIHLTWNVLFLPLFSFLALLTAIAVGVWLSAVNIKYRDVRHIIPFLVRAWMYASPVAYSSEYVTGKWKILYALNPMTGVIQGFRWALLGGERPDKLMLLSFLMILIILILGLRYFVKMEDSFADIV